MPSLDPLRAFAAQHGVVLRREALRLGWDDRDLRRACRSGILHKVRHGCYVPADLWNSLDDRGRHLVLAKAVLRSGEAPAVVSHTTAAVAHGMDVWGVGLRQAHLTPLNGLAGRTSADRVAHEGVVHPSEVTTVQGLPAVSPVRAAIETASLTGVEQGLVVLDSGLREGLFDSAELAAAHEAMSRWPSMRQVRLAVTLSDGRSASVGESRSRYLFWSQGLPSPELQYEVWHAGRLLGTTDFAWPELGLLGEFDGKVKYGKHLRPGERPEDALVREKRREDMIRMLTGFRFVRMMWADLSRPMVTAGLVRQLMRATA
jgi:hypothetical protein